MSGRREAVTLLSGGIDSAACAHLLVTKGFNVTAVFVDYGQSAAHLELHASRQIANSLGISHRVIGLQSDAKFDVGEIVGRNAFFVFAALLVSREAAGVIALGIHAGTPYYDCSPDFVSELDRVVAHHTDGRMSLFAPFVLWNKRDVFDYFKSTGMSIEMTYSCEAGTDPVCGKCASCLDRESL